MQKFLQSIISGIIWTRSRTVCTWANASGRFLSSSRWSGGNSAIGASSSTYPCRTSGTPMSFVGRKTTSDVDTADAAEVQEVIPDHPDKLRPQQRIRVACQVIAQNLWKENPTTTIADMCKCDAIQRLCGAGNYDEKTLRKWLSPVAPLEVREKRGRPKKNIIIN